VTSFRHGLALAAAAALLSAVPPAHGAMVTYFLDQTNFSALPDGVNYVQVEIDDNTAGRVTFNVSLLSPLTSIQAANFGIQEFTFNVLGTNPLQDASGDNAQWDLPEGWSANLPPPTNQADGFGRFELSLRTQGSGRVSPLSFALIGTGLTIDSFAELSSNNAGEGNRFFAAHVTGFDASGTTSGYFGGSTLAVVPLPAALPLLLSGFAIFGAVGYSRRRG
jgi:hypothetical protein